MENALLIGLSRQVALGRELDVIANNMANVTTNGFKARSSRFREYLMPVASAESFPRPDRRLSYVIDAGTPLDIRSGAIEHTGNPLDVAIKGDAFLAVQTPRRRALHPQRRPRDRRAGAARHQRRPHRPRRQRPDHLHAAGKRLRDRAGRHRHLQPGAARHAFASCASTTRRSCTTRARTCSRRRTAGSRPARRAASSRAPSSARTSGRWSR